MESPLEFLQALNQVLLVEPRTLRFCSTRLNSLLTSLELRDAADFVPISLVAGVESFELLLLLFLLNLSFKTLQRCSEHTQRVFAFSLSHMMSATPTSLILSFNSRTSYALTDQAY